MAPGIKVVSLRVDPNLKHQKELFRKEAVDIS